jgi:hypothetical protein
MTPPTPDAAFRWTRESWGLALRAVPLESAAQHLFTSRQLALRPQKTPGPQMTQMAQTAAHAWAAALASVGADPSRLRRVTQVHGNAVRVLPRGHAGPNDAVDKPDGDAVVSNEPGLALAVMVADCVPILLVDPVRGAAGAVHAGWRGTCARVAAVAVGRMAQEFGCNPADVLAAIGPSIGPGDYEVGESLVQAFLDAGYPRSDVDRWFSRHGARLFLDLWSANRGQLVAAGLAPGHVHACGLSTLPHPGVFDSFRRDGDAAGRMAAIIVVPAAGLR